MDSKEIKKNDESSVKEDVSVNEEGKVVNNENVRAESDEDISNSESEEKEEEKALSIEEQLDKLKAELNESNDKYLRLMAEFDNYRKRVLKEKTELILNGGERIITALLPIMDDFERVEQNMVNTDDLNSLKEGISLVIEKFRNTLEKDGLKRIAPVGEMFDVDYHEAIAMVPGQPDELKGKVIDCVLAGYKLNDKVIRHAKVAVAE